MRALTYAWSLPTKIAVTPLDPPYSPRYSQTCICYRIRVRAIDVYIAGIRIFNLFAPATLTLTLT